MSYSEPIKSRSDIEIIKKYLEETSKRNQVIFIIGINMPLKSQQILELKISDLIDENGIRDFLCIQGKKYRLNQAIKEVLVEFPKNKEDRNKFLFESAKTKKAINRSHLYRILKDVEIACNLGIHIGNESLRKTFGYHYYKRTRNIKKLKELFNKHSGNELLEYLDVKEEEEEFSL